MNLLQAFKFLDMVNENLDGYQEENKKYILEHIDRVQQFADWLKEKLPELVDQTTQGVFHKKREIKKMKG